MGRLQISVGDLSELLRPAVFVLAALASAWVLHDARRRFRLYAAAAWALLALPLPAVVLPLYLAVRLYQRRRDQQHDATESTNDATTDAAPAPDAATPHAPDLVDAPSTRDVEGEHDGRDETTSDGQADDSSSTLARARAGAAVALKRVALPLAYLAAVLLFGALYFYLDYVSFDAHYARARQAKLYNRPERTVRELRGALGAREDAHTRKLLGMELAEAGRWEEALAELRAAERGGEPDDRLVYREAYALEKLNRPDEAADAYRRFLQTQSCARPEPDSLCADARARIKKFGF